jgi:hypothetical protein
MKPCVETMIPQEEGFTFSYTLLENIPCQRGMRRSRICTRGVLMCVATVAKERSDWVSNLSWLTD